MCRLILTEMEGKEALNVIDAVPQIAVHNFSDMILGNKMFFHVIKLSESFHICVGSTPDVKNLAVSMQTKYDKVAVPGSILRGDPSDLVSLNMAQKLAKRTGKQVFVSCSVPYDQNLLPLIEKRIGEEITAHPGFF